LAAFSVGQADDCELRDAFGVDHTGSLFDAPTMHNFSSVVEALLLPNWKR